MKKSAEYLFYILILLGFTLGLAVYKANGYKANIELQKMQTAGPVPLSNKSGSNKIVYFWATWCGVCKANEAFIKKNYSWFNGRLNAELYSVEEGSGEKEKVEEYIKEHELPYPVIIGNEKFLQENGITGFPTTLFINSKNEVKFVDMGILNPISFYIRLILLNIL